MAHAGPGPKVAELTCPTRAPHALTITPARGAHGYDGVLPARALAQQEFIPTQVSALTTGPGFRVLEPAWRT